MTGTHLHAHPQCHLPALSLPEAAPAHHPQGLPGTATAPWPPAGPLTGPHARRTPIGAPASAPHRRGPRRGAHTAAPPPGEGPGQEGQAWAGTGLQALCPCPGPHACTCSPEPLPPRRALWSSPPKCPPWAATLSCSTATSQSTPPSPWRSSSAGAASGRVSGRGGQWGRTPDEQSVGGLLTQLHCVAVITGRGQTRPAVSSQTGCPGPRADGSPSLPAPFPDYSILWVKVHLVTYTGNQGFAMGHTGTVLVFLLSVCFVSSGPSSGICT